MEGDPAGKAAGMERQALATFVASLETQREVEQGARVKRLKEWRFGALLVSGLTLFAVAVGGYHPFAEDGGLYVAGVKRLLDPSLYPYGTEFVLEPTRLSLFAKAVAGMVRESHLALPVVLVGLHMASVWVTLAAAWMLAGRCWKGRKARAGAVVLLACWLTLPVAGTALMLMDPYVTARSFSTPCMMLALVGMLDATEWDGTAARRWRGFALWGASLAVATAMHPLMAMYAAGATLMLGCVRSSMRGVSVWGTVALSGAGIALAACVQAMARPESAEYVRVALTRTYWFPAEWRWFELVGLAAPLVILAAVGWTQAANAGRALARMAVAAGATACVIAMLFARAGAATHLVARMQPLRAFQIVYVVMVLALGARLGETLLRRSAWRWAAAMVLLGGVMLGAARDAYPNTSHLELPGMESRNAWVQAFAWIREKTPRDALFALDADYINARQDDAQCFRAIAERSALPDYSKDGGEASIAPELTGAWQVGQAAQQGLSGRLQARWGATDGAKADVARVRALAPLGVTWLVMRDRAVTDFVCPYANDVVKVCRLR
jgi:hypothetical protein